MECSILVYTISVNEVFVLGYYLPTTISKRHRKSGAVCLWRRRRQGSELARDIILSNAFLYLPILAATACTSSARGFGGGRSRRFRPRRRPSGTTGLQIYIPRQASVLMAKLPSSRPAATPQSRCPSDFCVAVRGANLRATLYQATRFFTFPFWQPLRTLHPCAQVRRLAEQDAFALPHHPGHVRHPSQTHPIFISLPLWRRGIYSMADPVHIIAVRHCKERGSGVSYIKHAGRVRACERG